MTLEELTKTKWYQEFKQDCPAQLEYAARLATDPTERFKIVKTDESGQMQHVIVPSKDGGFWMDAHPTHEQALALCREMGWKLA